MFGACISILIQLTTMLPFAAVPTGERQPTTNEGGLSVEIYAEKDPFLLGEHARIVVRVENRSAASVRLLDHCTVGTGSTPATAEGSGDATQPTDDSLKTLAVVQVKYYGPTRAGVDVPRLSAGRGVDVIDLQPGRSHFLLCSLPMPLLEAGRGELVALVHQGLEIRARSGPRSVEIREPPRQ